MNTLAGGNTSKIREVVSTFISKTPLQLKTLLENLQAENFYEAAKLVHIVKTRYGYFGLQHIASNFDSWESQLLSEQPIVNYSQSLAQIMEKTDQIIEVLKGTEYYQSPESSAPILPLKGKIVLVAEDDEINAMIFDLFIKELGAETIMSADGASALNFSREKNPDLIFMDVHMPFYSGLDAIRELRTLGCKCPIISLSASTRLNEKQNSLDAGANDFLKKPVNRDTISSILLRYLC